MKTLSISRPQRGFTLVELLVVIAIIAVLAAMGFAGAQAAINKAKKIKARKICVGLETAILGYYDEYGHLPVTGQSGSGGSQQERPVQTNTGEGIQLVNILVGSDIGKEENPKRIRFFEANETKNNRDGMRYSAQGNNVEGLFDPWGGPYYILMDLDYDETLEDPFTRGEKLRGRRVAVYSYGKNKTPDLGVADDVKSW